MHMPQMPSMPSMPTWREIWHKDHPIWALAQKIILVVGALIILQHGGTEIVGGAAPHSSEAIGGMWILRELIGWKRT